MGGKKNGEKVGSTMFCTVNYKQVMGGGYKKIHMAAIFCTLPNWAGTVGMANVQLLNGRLGCSLAAKTTVTSFFNFGQQVSFLEKHMLNK